MALSADVGARATVAWDRLLDRSDRAGLSRACVASYLGTTKAQSLRVRDDARLLAYVSRIDTLADRLQEGLNAGKLPCPFELQGLLAFMGSDHHDST